MKVVVVNENVMLLNVNGQSARLTGFTYYLCMKTDTDTVCVYYRVCDRNSTSGCVRFALAVN